MGKLGKSKYLNYFKIGDKFGKYEIVSENIIIEHEAKVNCKCECGKFNLVSCYTLVKGTSTRCLECGNSMKREDNPAWEGYGEIPGKIYSKIKRTAIKRKLEFDITIEELHNLFIKQDRKCALTGLDITTFGGNITASLDRIDSSKGYILNNIQWTHKDINMMKRNYSEKYFIQLCELVVKKALVL
jgi:hypothetical protein